MVVASGKSAMPLVDGSWRAVARIRAASACGMPVHARNVAATSGNVFGRYQATGPRAGSSAGMYSSGGETRIGLVVIRPHGPVAPVFEGPESAAAAAPVSPAPALRA